MKRSGIAALCILAGALFAQDGVTVKQQKYRGWGDNVLLYNQQAEITNDKNFYRFNYLQNKPNKQGNTETFMNLSGPREFYGFARAPINFLGISVNGISSRRLQPKNEDFKTWTRGDRGGASVLFRFDGAMLEMDVFLKKGSPILWFTFRPAAKQLEPIRSVKINVDLVISRLLTKNGVTVWENAYQRQAQTATRRLEQQKNFYSLEPEDKFVIFSDKELDGSGKDKGYGPSFLTFDSAGLQRATLNLRNSWLNGISFDLKPDFKEFTFGIWQKKDAISNSEFMKLFETEKSSFFLK